MPIQAPQWTEFLSCPVCCNGFDTETRGPVSLGCGHSICKACLSSLHRNQCPFDQSQIRVDILKIPLNGALVRLVGGVVTEEEIDPSILPPYNVAFYRRASHCIQDLALYLKPFSSGSVSVLSRPMQRKLVTLTNCQLLESEGRTRALRAARSLGERTVTELLLQHQNSQQLSANLWAAVRARGCQFLGPAMQEEVLKLVLLALEDGSALSRKVLVMFVVQRLEPHYSQASKTSIGHVVQLLYRASCFKVSKREGDSSLMQLKEEFRSYEALRREHDAQIVQIATEAGLRIAPDQWSALLYGDTAHKSHMQSIMDKLQTPQSFSQSVQELIMALQRTGDPGHLSPLRSHLELLANIDPSPECSVPSWEDTTAALEAARTVVSGLADFISQHGSRRQQDSCYSTTKYKINMCRDLTLRGTCPRGTNCTFAHSESELDRFRSRNRKVPSMEAGYTLTNQENCTYIDNQNIPNQPTFQPANLPSFETESYKTHTSQLQPVQAISTVHPKKPEPWNVSGKYSGVPRTRNLTALQQRKLEILCQLTGAAPEHEEYGPFELPVVNKYGPISRHPCNQALAYDDSLVPNSSYQSNNISQWARIPAPVNPDTYLYALNSPEQTTMYVQAPHDLLAESQRMKQQLRFLEKKIMDLRLASSGNHHNHQLVDELRRIQDSLQEEELYEAGIAEDMKELEQRWASELEEQERRWTESEPRPLN